MSNSKILREQFNKLRGAEMQIKTDIANLQHQHIEDTRSLHRHEKALAIIREVGLQTQQQLEYHISDITSMALQAVFDKPYELKATFIERRNKNECDITFYRDGNTYDPIDESGGGALDVAAFALRVASLSMLNNNAERVLILDEPFKHLKGEEANKRVLQMVKQISKQLGIQIIMVSDERVSRDITLEAADAVFEIRLTDDVSIILKN